jgi:hypothetical protein
VPSSNVPSPHADDRVVVSGDATLDGKRVDSRWVGAVVLHKGLETPCQVTLPPVKAGRYTVPIHAASESAGCGAVGARIALWIYAGDRIVFSTNTLAWPARGRTARFAARYSASTPAGAVPVAAQFTGDVFDATGNGWPVGARVEAFIGRTRCGVASLRESTDFTGYVLSVVGPDAVPGCTRGAPITFRVDGRPATSARVTNTPPGRHDPLDLTVS